MTVKLAILALIGGVLFMTVPIPTAITVHSTNEGRITAVKNIFVTKMVLLPAESTNQRISINLTSYENEFTLTIFNQSEHDKFLDGLPAIAIYNVTGTNIETTISLDPPIHGWIVITLVSRGADLSVNGDIVCDFLTPYYGYGFGLFFTAAVLIGYTYYKRR